MKVSATLLAATASLPLALSQKTTDKCSPVHVFLARGNNEPYPGRQGKLVDAICGKLKDGTCDYEDIQFYNPLPAPYCESVEEGATNGAKQIKAYNKKCPKSKLVVSGYSQGGHVVGDVLGGGGGVFFQDCVQRPNPALDPNSAAGKAIVAAMIFGDTRHTAGQAYNYESGADKNGLFPRPGDQLDGLNAYTDVLRNFCVASDPICAQGKTVDNHLNYFDKYSDEMADWVAEKVNKATGGESEGDEEITSTSKESSSKTSSSESSGETLEVDTDATSATKTTSSSESESTTEASSDVESTAAPSSSSSSSGTDEASSSSGPSETSDSGNDDDDDDDEDAAGALVPSFAIVALGLFAALV